MSAFDPNNPIVLFGDVGPDVLALSQVYDPDTDEYALSHDEYAVAGKTYYIRTYSNKTVEFTEVTGVAPGSSTPESNGWYEKNLDGAKSTGKYVPAIDSIVVVDVATEDYAKYTILIVDDVNETTLKATLVPHNCGADDGTTARAIKYGTGDYHLFFETVRVNDADRTLLIPDRKLLLYGSRYYMYRIVSRKTEYTDNPDQELKDVVVSTPYPDVDLEHIYEGFAPYLSPSAAQITLTNDAASDNYYGKDQFAGRKFCRVNGAGFVAITIPKAPEEGDSGYVPTLDPVYQGDVATTGRHYFVKVPDTYDRTSDVVYQDGETYYYISSHDEHADPVYSVLDPATYNVGDTIPSEVELYVKTAGGYSQLRECFYSLYSGARTGSPKTKSGGLYETNRIGQYVKTNDTSFVTNKKYYTQSTPASSIDSGYWFTAGTEIGWVVDAESGSGSYKKFDIYQHPNVVFGVEGGVQGWLYDPDQDQKNVFYPAACYLKNDFSIQAGDIFNMEVYELCENSTSIRLVLNVTLHAREGNVIAGSSSQTKRITKFDVENSEEIEPNRDDIWLLPQFGSVSTLLKDMIPVLHYDDGSYRVIDKDDPGLFIYGLEAIDSTIKYGDLTIGREYPVLFKYFPGKSNYNNPEHYVNSNYSKGFLTDTKTVRVSNTADVTIRKISIIPIGNDMGEYAFRYLQYDNTFKSPTIVDNTGTAIHIEEDGADGGINPIAAADNHKNYVFDDHSYLDEHNIVNHVDNNEEPSSVLFGYVQHCTLAIRAKADGYSNAIFSQRMAFQLQNWTRNDFPVKWLIGSDTTKYDPNLMPYGNPMAGVRPYIEFHADEYTDPENSRPFSIGSKFSGSTTSSGNAMKSAESFLQSFYYNADPPAATIEGIVGESVTPNYFIVRSLQTRGIYTNLATDHPVVDIVYVDPVTEREIRVDEDTDVTDYGIKYTGKVRFYRNGEEGKEVVPEDDLPVGSIIAPVDKELYFTKKTVEINSGYIDLEENMGDINIASWMERFNLPGISRVVDEEGDYIFGGAIPNVNDSGTTMTMGTVIVEFGYMDHSDSDTGGTRYALYGVPVEVRFPYTLTSDYVALAGKTYYKWNREERKFEAISVEVGANLDRATWEAY